MTASAILPPGGCGLCGHLGLWMRLCIVRWRYARRRPSGGSPGRRLRFDLAQLERGWAQIVRFQQAVGLEGAPFTPRESFERIYAITALALREFQHPDNTVIDFSGAWETYNACLGQLSHELNPFEFSDVCARCHRAISALNRPAAPPEAEDQPVCGGTRSMAGF